MTAASVGFHCPSCVAEGRVGQRPRQAAYGGRARANPEVTYALLGLNVVMFLLTVASGSSLALGGQVSDLFQKLALTPSLHAVVVNGVPTLGDGVAQGQYYRLLTSMFLHFGIVHLALNMYCLFLVGPALEHAFGRLRFLGLYVLSGLGGSALSYALGPTSELAAGASGAVFGLFAAYFVLERKRGSDLSQIGATIALNLVFSFAIPNIDWRGHVGGLVAGALVAAALVHAPAGRSRWAYQAIGSLGVAVLIVGMVAVRTSQLGG